MLILDVVTPTKKILSSVKARSVTVPGASGEMTILPGHAALISCLDTGILRYEAENGQERRSAALSTGFVEVAEDRIVLMAETLEMAHQIDIERAKKAQKKAEDKLKEKDVDPDSFNKYQLKLQRALIRQQVALELGK